MDNNRLNDLFNQAKNEAPKASFDDIKRQFEQSLITAGGSATTGLLTFKNLLMIGTISTISVGAIMVLDTVTTPKLKETVTHEPIKTIEHIEQTKVEEEHNRIVEAYVERVERLDPVLKQNSGVERELALKTMLPSLSITSAHHQIKKQSLSGMDSVEIDTTFRIPRLTEEERAANNKQKAKMIKQLLKQDKKVYAYIPSGTTTIKGEKVSVQAFYMQTTEVSNLEYRTFLFDLILQGREDEFMKARPIQKTWVTEYKYSFMKPMEAHYFSHPAYNDYPVVAISREGAKLYCKWLTQEANKVNQEKGKPLLNDLRIPSDYEWMYAAKGGKPDHVYPWGGPYLRNAKGDYLANYKPKKDNFKEDGGFFQTKVNSYFPNGFGLYCMAGNVAEMVIYLKENKTPGSKGGSWSSIGQELQIEDGKDRFKGLTKPSVNVGFRPVMTYLGK